MANKNTGLSGPAVLVISDLLEYNQELYLTGSFYINENILTNSIARWNGSNWKTLGDPPKNTIAANVSVMEVFKNELYIVGDFADGGNYGKLLKWDGNQLEGVISPFDEINDLVVFENDLLYQRYF